MRKKSRADVNFLFGTDGKSLTDFLEKDIIMTLGSMEKQWFLTLSASFYIPKKRKEQSVNDKKKRCVCHRS